MNKIFIIIFILTSTIAFSQQKGSHSGNGNFHVNVKKLAGIVPYDSDEVIKRIKVKKSENKIIVEQAIDKYNQKINELKIFNTDIFTSVKLFINQKSQEAKLSNDINILKEAKIKVDETLQPLKDKVAKAQNVLDKEFKIRLNAKQLKAWSKYVKRKKEALKPKAPSRPPMQNQGMRSRRGQGMNRY
ncbi:hypothetical protein [Lutibacter sp.]|uniref:hypothetical protein n=1 Tax=Lutibacter sp. TaxID=1925666 RepID=UPI0025BDA932|nr:hypothetical protein [Lutibacter sp.]MCF6181617.1 hypothetical protein [Lutibacter sp.]